MIEGLPGISLGLRTLFHVPYKHPTMAQVSITTRCNTVCRMCPREVLELPENDMPAEKAFQVIEKLGVIKKIALVGLGEPLLHPELDQIIDFAEHRSIQTQISTNGLLLEDEERVLDLFKSGLQGLTFSLEDLSGTSSSGHQNKRIRAIIENCLRLRAKLGLKRPRITVQIVLLPETIKFLKEIVEWACRSGVDHLNITRVNTVLDPELQRPDLEEERACFRTLRSLRRAYPLRIDCFQDQIYPGILGAIYRRLLPLARLETWCVKWSYYIYIDIKGDIFPCSGLFPPELSLGNIFTHRLPDIWNGPGLRTLRSSKARKIPCRYCDNLRLQMRTSPGYKKIKELIQAGNMN